jgi:hypothetical protein
MSKKKLPIWAITYEPEGPRSRYYGLDGKPTFKNRAAEFFSREEAKRFADSQNLEIGGLVHIVITRYGRTI